MTALNTLLAILGSGRPVAMLPSAYEAEGARLAAANLDLVKCALPIGIATNPVREGDRPYEVRQGVALIPVTGLMTKGLHYPGFLASNDYLAYMVRTAVRDTDVTGILVVAATGGGAVWGLDELYQDLRSASLVKPTACHIDGGAFSAGYYAACGCLSISINRTGETGSLGSMVVLQESKAMADAMGIDVQVYGTGPLKGQGWPGTAFSDEYVDETRRRVNEAGAFFAAVIAEGRGMEPEQVAEVFTGGLFSAETALSLGLVDRIASLDEAFADLLATAGDGADPDDGPLDAATGRESLSVARNAAATLIGATVDGETALGLALEAGVLLPTIETVVLSDARKAALSTGGATIPSAKANPRIGGAGERPSEPKPAAFGRETPTQVSAPGGSPGSAGTSTAPRKGAENRPQEGTKTMSDTQNKPVAYQETGTVTKLQLQAALNNAGLHDVGTLLGQSEATDPHGIAHALARGITAQVNAGIGLDDRLIALDSVGARSAKDVYRLGNDAKVGKEARDLAMERCEAAYIHNNGTEGLGQARMQWEDKTYAGLVAKAESLEAESDAKNRNSKTEPARRLSASGGPVARDVDPADPEADRPWSRLAADVQAEAKALPTVGEDKAKQDAFALNLLGEAA